MAQFVVMEHKAYRAGLHYDLRFEMPRSNKWASFAVRKGIPLEPGKKVLAVRTHDHSRREALYTGRIKAGEYGGGTLKKWDGGRCDVLKFKPASMTVKFKGSKLKGIYHLVNTGVIDKKYDKPTYLLFKSSKLTEILSFLETSNDSFSGIGLVSRVPPGDTQEVEIDDETADKQQRKNLSWALKIIQRQNVNELFKPKEPIKKIKHLKIIDKLGLDKKKTLIIGSAVLVLHGILDKNKDLDLVVTRDQLRKLKRKKGIIKDYKFNKVFYRTKDRSMEAAVNFQLMNITTEKLLKRSIKVDGYKFMSLRDTYKMYKTLNRPKDKEKLKRLERIFH
jgi:DNA ligase D-like protein (predicted 3'-phosphoesterase)